MLTEVFTGQGALEAALLADLGRDAELERIEQAFRAITEKLNELIKQLN